VACPVRRSVSDAPLVAKLAKQRQRLGQQRHGLRLATIGPIMA